MKYHHALLGFAAAGLMLGSTPAGAFSASFRWCSGTPEFRLSKVPKGTVTLDFQMTDLMAPTYQHGGGSVSFSGQKAIPCDGLSGGAYRGPSPPPPQIHTYRWTIKALDSSGGVLATTTSQRKFPQ
jgi:phosphatidylethanolamine-binding protein (PEBP) family uncharacterized protein